MPNASRVIPADVAKRAATNYTVVGEHWISNYSVASHGYAQVGWSGPERGMTTAHRAAWVHHFGHPGDQVVDHRNFCGEHRCVRPDHLRLLSNLDNARRTFGRDWPKGRCINGHDHETYWRPKGPERAKGYCSECRKH